LAELKQSTIVPGNGQEDEVGWQDACAIGLPRGFVAYPTSSDVKSQMHLNKEQSKTVASLNTNTTTGKKCY